MGLLAESTYQDINIMHVFVEEFMGEMNNSPRYNWMPREE
jgi:hypothetical protein